MVEQAAYREVGFLTAFSGIVIFFFLCVSLFPPIFLLNPLESCRMNDWKTWKETWLNQRCFVISLHFNKSEAEWISATSKSVPVKEVSKNLSPFPYFEASTTHCAPLRSHMNTHTHTQVELSLCTKTCSAVLEKTTRASC